MKIIGIMPIKLQNERLPGKNTKLLGDKPLLQYALDNLLATKLCDEIYVYCSDDSIKDYLPNGISFLKRDKSLDLPTSNFTQIFSSFSNQINADIYVFMHATAPFVTIDTMTECSFIPFRTTRTYVSSEVSKSASTNTCKLTKDEMDTLCNEVATMIASMGFNDYKVEAVPMHFYSLLHEKRTGFFGSKGINKKIDDGIGHVLKVTISW